ncbi:MAG: 30S ribosomal protein S6, partial [Dehalococcoidales bacterium]|nr:30S ribosomal protein S6 [Dehalococcoidales bacterium]
ETKKLNEYELIIIFNPELTEEKLTADIDNVKKFITGKGGDITDTKPWGKRRLAYSIKHSMEGNYILIKFKMKPNFNRELETSLRISEDVLRHLLVKVG